MTLSIADMTPHERLERFYALCAAGTPTKVAGESCGYTERTAQEYRRRGRDRIRELAVERFDEHVPVAIQQLINLMTGSKSDAVRESCANRILAACNLDVVQKHSISVLSDAELNQQMLALCGGDKLKLQQVMDILSDKNPSA